MGVDAYNLAKFIKRDEGRVYEGATGNLKISHNYVKRQLACAQIKDGVPQALAEDHALTYHQTSEN